MIGDTQVGKTSLMRQFQENDFPQWSLSTIGIDFRVSEFVIDGRKVKLQIWDTAGQERFHAITRSYYRDTHAVVLVYDVTSQMSFDHVEYWLNEINVHGECLYRVLVGNKNDDPNHLVARKVVSTEKAKALAQELGVKFFETSAKYNINVKELFEEIAKDLLDERLRSSLRPRGDGFALDEPKKSKPKCCQSTENRLDKLVPAITRKLKI